MVKNLRKRGFALAELAIIVAIVAILAAILIPTLSGVFKNTPITGEDGLTPSIGENGNWWLGEVDTEVSAEGRDGRDVSFRVAEGKIQMQYEGQTGWTNLVDLTTLIGATGPAGPAGSAGTDGREVNLRVSAGGFVQWQYEGETAWVDLISLASLTGAAGNDGSDGREVEMRVTAGFIQWRYEGAAVWTDLVALASLTGADGAAGTDGREVQMRVFGGNIEWKYQNEATWSSLVSLSALTGPMGPTGATGSTGAAGTDGREVEMQVSGGNIEWRYVGSATWSTLVDLASLTGPAGAAGNDGKEVEMQVGAGFIQWRYVGDVAWTDLVSLASLTGANGVDAKNVDFRAFGGFIQWQYIGDATWTNLVDLSTMVGNDGLDGLSAFEIYKVHNPNYYKTEPEWVTDLVRGKLSDSDTTDILDYNQLLTAIAAGVTKMQFQYDITATLEVELTHLSDINFNGYKLVGDLFINTLEVGTMNITGSGTLTGNLKIDAANASINSDLNVDGITTIIAISSSTFNTTGTHTGGIHMMSGGRIVRDVTPPSSTIYIYAIPGQEVILSGSFENVIIIGDSDVIINGGNVGSLEIRGTANVQVINGSNVDFIDGSSPEGLNSQIEVSLDSTVPPIGPDNNITQTGYSAEFVATGATGFNLGVLYQEYRLMANGVIDLSNSNIANITMKDPSGVDHNLTPDTDMTLWFNVESAAGTYMFTVEEIAGSTYIADLVWNGIEEVTPQFTGGIGIPPLPNAQVIFKEYALGALDLSSFDVMYAVNPADVVSELVANTDTTLWFNSTAVSGDYTYYVRQDGEWFKSVLTHVNEVASFDSSNATGFHNNNLYEEFVLTFAGNPISLAATAVSYIAQDEVALIPDTDTTLWFNVEKAAGTYEYVVVTSEGDVYTSSIVWGGIAVANPVFTEGIGVPPVATGQAQNIYKEYQLGTLDLSSFDAMYGVNPAGDQREMTANTDTTLWFNAFAVSGTYTYYVKQGADWFKSELVHVNEVADFTTSNATGFHAGNLYQEFVLAFAGKPISLAATNVAYIAQDEVELIPDTDTTLWFNVNKTAGTNEFVVVTKAGEVYTSSITWDGIEEVTPQFTGGIGIPPLPNAQVIFKEYALGALDLSSFDVMYEVNPAGDERVMTANTDTTLWFNTTLVSGDYTYYVRQGGEWFKSVLTHVNEVASFDSSNATGFHNNNLYEEFVLTFAGNPISLAATAVSYIAQDEVALIPDTDTTLWFNVEKAAGTYEYVVVTSEGDVYTSSIVWGGIAVANPVFTEGIGVPPVATGQAQNIYKEYQLGTLDLSSFDAMYGVNPAGDQREMTANTDTTLWFNAFAVSGTYTYYVKQGADWFKSELVHVNEVADFTTSNATGFHAGNLYQEFVLAFAGKPISLAATNVAYIAQDEVELIPDTDTTLWFNVNKAAGTNEFVVVTKAGEVYTSSITWDGIEEVTPQFTGGIGIPPLPNAQVIFKEYALGALDLSSFDVMYEVNPAGDERVMTANTDTTLWFNTTLVSGDYTYYVRQGGEWFKSVLTHVNEVASFDSSNATGFHNNNLYEEFVLTFAGNPISLAATAVSYIAQDEVALIPDTDTTLWFNVEKAAGTYEYVVVTSEGDVYTSSIVWGGIAVANPVFTEGIGVPPVATGQAQNIYKEYQLGTLDLSSFDAMYGVNPAGDQREMTANTDTTLWFNAFAVSGTYTYYVKQGADWFKSELVHVNEVADFTTSNATGFHAGNLYQEFVLAFAGNPISLAATNVAYIAQDEVELIPDTDTTLWFNVNKAAGTNEFVVVTKAGEVYTSSITWDGIEEVDAVLTGNFGDNLGVTYVEYQLGALDLSSFDVMYSVDPIGTVVQLVANVDSNLWFNVAKADGAHTFYVKQGNVWSKSIVNWPAPYTIEFDSKNGSPVDPITQGYGTVVTEPAIPTRLGGSFEGWFVDEAYTTPYTFTTMPINGIQLYAKWEIASYTLNLIKDGIVFGTQTIEYNTPISIVNPVKTGYTFNAWYTDAAFTTLFTDVNMPAYNVTLYAKFTINQYTINFVDFDLTVIESYTFDYNQLVSGAAYPANPSRTGYTFTGWVGVVPVNMPANNVLIQAEYDINQYTIIWKINGSETAQTEDYGTIVLEPSNPSKTGYSFISWDTVVPETFPAYNLVITAQFVINEYTIYFDVDGVIEAQITFDYNEIINAYVPEKPGYAFKGWYEEELLLTPFIITIMPAHDITVYAKWEDSKDPEIISATGVRDLEGNLILTVEASDAHLYELEVDHSFEGTLPEFSVYASEAHPYGTPGDEAQFIAAGITVEYVETTQTWTLTFAKDGVAMGVINNPAGTNGAISFYLVAIDEVGNASGSMYDGTYETVSVLANQLPEITSANVVKNIDGDLILTVVANDENLYSLEVDHSLEAVLPEFSVYASELNPWGTQDDHDAFDAAGVIVAYDESTQTFTLTFANDGVAMGIINNTPTPNGAIDFYLVLHDQTGNSSGSMYDGTYETVSQPAN